jgi:hypothetical protein
MSEDHPRRRGHRRGLRFEAGQFIVADTAAELVTGVAANHRVHSLARPAAIIPR